MSDFTPSEWQEKLTGEILLLGLVGRAIYNYPNEEERAWLQSLMDEDVFSEAPFASDQDETRAGLELLQKWGQDELTGRTIEQLQSDYTRLFIGSGTVLAPPWESVHFNDDRLVFQERTLMVRAWYQRFGLVSEKVHREPDDHIGLELLFLSHLAKLGVRALNEQDKSRFEELLAAQREFIKEHLGAWAPTWCDLVELHAKTDFYKGLALLIRGAVSALNETLDIRPLKDTPR